MDDSKKAQPEFKIEQIVDTPEASAQRFQDVYGDTMHRAVKDFCRHCGAGVEPKQNPTKLEAAAMRLKMCLTCAETVKGRDGRA